MWQVGQHDQKVDILWRWQRDRNYMSRKLRLLKHVLQAEQARYSLFNSIFLCTCVVRYCGQGGLGVQCAPLFWGWRREYDKFSSSHPSLTSSLTYRYISPASEMQKRKMNVIDRKWVTLSSLSAVEWVSNSFTGSDGCECQLSCVCSLSSLLLIPIPQLSFSTWSTNTSWARG